MNNTLLQHTSNTTAQVRCDWRNSQVSLRRVKFSCFVASHTLLCDSLSPPAAVITHLWASAPCKHVRTWVWRRVLATVCAGRWPDWAEVLPRRRLCSSDGQPSVLPEPRVPGPDPVLCSYQGLKAEACRQETRCISDTEESAGRHIQKHTFI